MLRRFVSPVHLAKVRAVELADFGATEVIIGAVLVDLIAIDLVRAWVDGRVVVVAVDVGAEAVVVFVRRRRVVVICRVVVIRRVVVICRVVVVCRVVIIGRVVVV